MDIYHAPRIGPAQFQEILADAGSPLLADADDAYYACVDARLDPAVILALAKVESAYGTAFNLDVPSNCNIFNIRNKPEYPAGANGYAGFPSWLAGWQAAVERIATHPLYAGLTTVAELVAVWAPASENDTAAYVASVERLVQEWSIPMPIDRPLHFALSYGHINKNTGNATEIAQTPVIGGAIRDACRARGMEVRVVQEELDFSAKTWTLDDVAARVVKWDGEGWEVDLYMEVHTEGGGGGGVFGIYPAYGADVDLEARDLGLAIAAAVRGAIGLRLGGTGASGAMAEYSTSAKTLGIFRGTASINDHAERLIVEYGAHDLPAELALVNAHVAEIGEATAAAIGTHYDLTPPAPADPDAAAKAAIDLAMGQLPWWACGEKQFAFTWRRADGGALFGVRYERLAVAYWPANEPGARVLGMFIEEWATEFQAGRIQRW